MAQSPEEYRKHVGFVVFPRSTDDLTDTTRCPACHRPLSTLVCQNCGLDLSNPVAAELAEASTQAAQALDRRLDLIGRIRFEATQGADSPASAADTLDAPALAASTLAAPPVSPSVSTPSPVPPAMQPPSVPQPSVALAPRRQISVQVVLLLVGVALLSIGAIFFLVYAFINFGLVWRSLIIATVTIAAYVGATLLIRRRLTATAESVAVLAVVLTYLDAFALRANDLLVVGDSQGFAHWGGTLLISAIGFIAWNRLTGVRVASIVGFATVPPGLALLTLGLSERLPNALPPYLALLALAIGCLAHPLAGRLTRPLGAALPERYAMVVTAILAIASAGVVAPFLAPQTPFASTIGLLVVAVTAAAHADLSIRSRLPLGFSSAFAALGAVTAGISLTIAQPISSDPAYSTLVPVLWAALLALALEAVYRRAKSTEARIPLLVASIVAAALAAIGALAPLGWTVSGVLKTLEADGVWSVAGNAAIVLRAENYWAVVVLGAAVLLVTVAWAVQGLLSRRVHFVLWAASAVLLLSAPLAAVLWASVAIWMLLGIAAAAALAFTPLRSELRAPVLVGGIAAVALGYATSWTSVDTWLIGSTGALLSLLIGRIATAQPLARAAVTGLAVVVALVAAAAAGWRVQELTAHPASAPVLATIAVAALATLLLIGTGFASRFLAKEEIRAIYWIALGAALYASASLWVTATVAGESLVRDLAVPGNLVLVVVSAALVAAVLVWIAGGASAMFRAERVTASVVLAPSLAWFAIALALSFSAVPPTNSLPLFAVIAVALVAACALGIARFSPGLNLRSFVDVGVASVALGATAVAVVTVSDLAWLVLLLAAIVTLLLAVSLDGLFASDSPRRVLGWVSLALAVSALVWLLVTEQVQDVASYVLPPAGALLLVAAAAWFSARRRGLASAGAPWIALAGLVLALVSLGLVHSVELSPWLLIVAGVSSALLLKGSLLRTAMATRPYLDAAALAGALGLLVSAYGRAYALAVAGNGTVELVVWLSAAFAIFTIAAFGVAIQARDLPSRAIASQVVLGIPMVLTFLLGLIAIGNGPAGITGGVSLVVLFAAIHVAGGLFNRLPFTRAMAWIAIALAVASWLVASSLGALQPLEWATVPLAVALLITGSAQLVRSPEARSWAWLSPGILVLIAPSLLASFVDEPIWRLVGVGVACVAAIIAGALLRLQAPLVLGAVLVLIHGLRTFAPQLVAVYQLTEWWVWAVVGGAIIFFIGFTFEKRKRDFQNTATKIAALR